MFDYELGDDERIIHKPLLLGDRGKQIAVYAIAKTKDGGIYREVMTINEVEKVRELLGQDNMVLGKNGMTRWQRKL